MSRERRSSRWSKVLGFGEVARVEVLSPAWREVVDGTSRVAVDWEDIDAIGFFF